MASATSKRCRVRWPVANADAAQSRDMDHRIDQLEERVLQLEHQFRRK